MFKPFLDFLKKHITDATAFVEEDVLNTMYSLIEHAAIGPIGPPETQCFDLGLYYYYAYQYDSESGNYIPVLIHIGGVYDQENLAPAADVLFSWLKSITEAFSDPGCGF